MKFLILLITSLILLQNSVAQTNDYYGGQLQQEGNKLLLKDIPVLKFNKSKMKCIGGLAVNETEYYHPNLIKCKNMGNNNSGKVIWKCKARNLNRLVKLNNTDVICKGYQNDNDEYINGDTCIVQYELIYRRNNHININFENFISFLFISIFFSLIGYSIYDQCINKNTTKRKEVHNNKNKIKNTKNKNNRNNRFKNNKVKNKYNKNKRNNNSFKNYRQKETITTPNNNPDDSDSDCSEYSSYSSDFSWSDSD